MSEQTRPLSRRTLFFYGLALGEQGRYQEAIRNFASTVLEALRALFAAPGPKSHVLGEFGIGLNPLAELTGVMLEDEGCLGTIHFGFGSNSNSIGSSHNRTTYLTFKMLSHLHPGDRSACCRE